MKKKDLLKTKQIFSIVISIAILSILFGCQKIILTPLFSGATEVIDSEESVKPKEAKLSTIQRCVLWGESGTINLQDIINKKRCAMNPNFVIGTDAKSDVSAAKEVQKAGGKMALLVHPFYSPWSNGEKASLKELKKSAKYYDYIAIDYEAKWIDLDFVNKCKQFGKPVIVAPLARIDSMNKDYENFAKMKDITFLWWNYSYKLKDWKKFFKDHKFDESCRHLVLVSIGDKYREFVSDGEVREIILNLKDVRAGSFSPNNDYSAFQKVKEDLIKEK
jgi:hypothetical protein